MVLIELRLFLKIKKVLKKYRHYEIITLSLIYQSDHIFANCLLNIMRLLGNQACDFHY